MTITIEQIRDKYKAIAEEFKVRQAELEAMIEEYKKQQETVFPKDGDIYYLIEETGDINSTEFKSTSRYNEKMLSVGNCFRTKEEAEFAVEQLKVIAEMKRCGGVWKNKHSGPTEYYLSQPDEDLPICIEDSCFNDITPDMWFPTEEQALKALNTIGEERLLKYWFCVEVKE